MSHVILLYKGTCKYDSHSCRSYFDKCNCCITEQTAFRKRCFIFPPICTLTQRLVLIIIIRYLIFKTSLICFVYFDLKNIQYLVSSSFLFMLSSHRRMTTVYLNTSLSLAISNHSSSLSYFHSPYSRIILPIDIYFSLYTALHQTQTWLDSHKEVL